MSSYVLEWYENVFTRVVDLVGDYAGKELFLVEGDSLLLKCFKDKRLDFNGKLKSKNGVAKAVNLTMSLQMGSSSFTRFILWSRS